MSKSQNTEIQYSLTVNTEIAYRDVRKLEISLMRILGYIQRLAPNDPNLDKLINTMQSAIMTMRSMQIALLAVQAAAGPVGWLYAGTAIAAGAFSGYSLYESMRGT